MSEYQRVAFRAIDGPVRKENLEYMERQSSRAEITPWSFDRLTVKSASSWRTCASRWPALRIPPWLMNAPQSWRKKSQLSGCWSPNCVAQDSWRNEALRECAQRVAVPVKC